MHIIAFNAGSSSLKFQLMNTNTEQAIASGKAEWSGTKTRYTLTSGDLDSKSDEVEWSDIRSAVRRAIADIRTVTDVKIDAIAHRVVHGGTQFTAPVLITESVVASLHDLVYLAPLHNAHSLQGIETAGKTFPELPQVAVFDTTFHQTLSPAAFTYAVPHDWTEAWKIRRFGFHGLSHEYCTTRAGEMLKQPHADLRLVIAHLGHGASLAAVSNGKSVDTTMGFTPLEGPMMATRSGSIDPGVLLHVMRDHGLTANEADKLLNQHSGLLGVSGVSADMREVQHAADSGNERAILAIAMYVHSLRKSIGAMAASLGGVDALVFTGGIGENAAAIREATCSGLFFLGLETDPVTNAAPLADTVISSSASPTKILVVATNEELMICQKAKALLTNPGGRNSGQVEAVLKNTS